MLSGFGISSSKKLVHISQLVINLILVVVVNAQIQDPLLSTPLVWQPLARYPEWSFRYNLCPITDTPSQPILMPFQYDCNKYISCLNGYAYIFSCPDGLHWSIDTNRCDNVGIANCINGNQQPRPPPPLVSNASQAAEVKLSYPITTSKYQSHPDDCSKFYQCQQLHCPTPLHWNPFLQRCDNPQNVGCTTPSWIDSNIWSPLPNAQPPTATTSSSTYSYPTYRPLTSPMIPQNYYKPLPNPPISPSDRLQELCQLSGLDYIVHPDDCHRFIQCNGQAFVHNCPAGLFWNSQIMSCDRFCK